MRTTPSALQAHLSQPVTTTCRLLRLKLNPKQVSDYAPSPSIQHCGPEWQFQALPDNTEWDYLSLVNESAVFSRDGKFLFVTAYTEVWEPEYIYQSTLFVYNTETLALVYARNLSADAEAHTENTKMAVSNDGAKLAVVSGNDNHTLMVYTIASDGTLSLLGRSGFHSLWDTWPYVRWVTFDPTDQYVLAGGEQLGHTFSLSDFSGAQGFLNLARPSTHNYSGAFSPDGQYFALGWTNGATTIPGVPFAVYSGIAGSPVNVMEYYDPYQGARGQLGCADVAWFPDSARVLAAFWRINQPTMDVDVFQGFSIPSGASFEVPKLYGFPHPEGLSLCPEGKYLFLTQSVIRGDAGPLVEVYCTETWKKTKPPVSVTSHYPRGVVFSPVGGKVAWRGSSLYGETSLPIQLYTY